MLRHTVEQSRKSRKQMFHIYITARIDPLQQELFRGSSEERHAIIRGNCAGISGTFILRFLQVKHPVLVLLFISFLCLPPDIIRSVFPTEGNGYLSGWLLGDEVMCVMAGGGRPC